MMLQHAVGVPAGPIQHLIVYSSMSLLCKRMKSLNTFMLPSWCQPIPAAGCQEAPQHPPWRQKPVCWPACFSVKQCAQIVSLILRLQNSGMRNLAS